MSSASREKNLNKFDLPSDRIQSRLNEIWNDCQTNLPEIDFDDEKADEDEIFDSNKIENFDFSDEKKSGYDEENNQDYFGIELNNELTLNKSKLEKYFNNHEYQNDQQNITNSSISLSDVCLSDLNNLNIDLKLKSLSKFKSNNSSNDSINSAAKITKNIFDSTNTKLSMGKLDSINMDDLLDSIAKNSNRENENSNFRKQNNLKSGSRLLNDETVLMKLAEMSVSISNDANLNNLDLITGALTTTNSNTNSKNNASSNQRFINKGFSNVSPRELNRLNPISESCFKLMESEVKKIDKSFLNEKDELNEDLKRYLKAHNMKDGNLVETRKLDLRSSQILTKSHDPTKRFNSTQKKNIAQLFENIILSDTNNENDLKQIQLLNQTKTKKEIYGNISSSSSSESESDDDKTLWIERYRKQKLNLTKNSTTN